MVRGGRVRSMGVSLQWAWNHPANSQSRVRGATHVLRYWVGSRVLGRPTLIVEREGIQFAVRPSAHGLTKVMYAFPPDYWEMILWSKVLTRGDLFVDVGANAGVYSMWAASLGADVVAYEPSEDSWADLQTNVKLNRWPIDTRMVAVGAAVGEVLLTTGLDAMNHIVEPREGYVDCVAKVPITTLDAAFPGRIRGLKVDVEGHESEVFQGAQQLLTDRRVDLIQFEWNGLGRDRLVSAPSILQDNGYRLYRVGASGLLSVAGSNPEPGSDLIAASPGFAARLEQPGFI